MTEHQPTPVQRKILKRLWQGGRLVCFANGRVAFVSMRQERSDVVSRVSFSSLVLRGLIEQTYPFSENEYVYELTAQGRATLLWQESAP